VVSHIPKGCVAFVLKVKWSKKIILGLLTLEDEDTMVLRNV
jgi:hypothetical protein